MKIPSRTALLAAAVLVSTVASAAAPGRLVVPTAASIHGLNGTYFRTDLDLLNQSFTDPVTVDLTYPRASRTVTVSLNPREARTFRDIVGTSFQSPETFGGIVISWSGGPVVASSRTYTVGAGGGSIGTRIPAVEDSARLNAATFVAVASSGGVLTSGFRSNVGFFNPGYSDGSGGVVTVTFALYDALARPLGAPRTVSVGGSLQINDVFSACGAGGVTTKNARLVVTSDMPVFSYVTVIDNLTGDSFYVQPFPLQAPQPNVRTPLYPLIPVPDVVLPAAVSKRGVGGTLFQSDLWLLNTKSEPTSVTLSFKAVEGPVTVSRSVGVSFEPYETKLWEDVLHSLFDSTESFGAIHVGQPGFNTSASVLAFSRVYAASGQSGGTLGSEFAALMGPLTGKMVFPGVLSYGTDPRRGHRTNVGVTGYGYPALQVTLFNAFGLQIGRPVYLPLGDLPAQVNDIFAAAEVPGDTTYATLVLDASGASVYPYVTVIDNESGDSVVVPPLADTSPP